MSAAVETSVDWALLEADMPAIPCEHRGHSIPSQAAWHGGEATHYYRGKCPSCGGMSPLGPVCAAFVNACCTSLKSTCERCGHRGIAREFIETLQPIKATR